MAPPILMKLKELGMMIDSKCVAKLYKITSCACRLDLCMSIKKPLQFVTAKTKNKGTVSLVGSERGLFFILYFGSYDSRYIYELH
jgi:hypothetical protein